jgi:small subunit ribosomal protein S16
MLIIRLQRTGKRNASDFRIVLAEKTSAASKKVTEILGSYNPRRKDFRIKEERAKYWIGNRVEMSPTVHNLFVSKGLLDAKKVKAFNTPKKPAEVAAEKPAESAKTETPAEAQEATATMEEEVTPKGEDTAADVEAKSEPAPEAQA